MLSTVDSIQSLLARVSVAALAVIAGACAAPPDASTSATDDLVVGVPQTATERASIGASWLYAEASWAGTLHAAASDDGLDPSAAYWAYWHWFDQLAYGTGSTIVTGGNWETGHQIAIKYGLVSDHAFLAGGSLDSAERTSAALATISQSLDAGPLSTPGGRSDHLVVRRELDRAFGLSPDVVATLDRVFGDKVDRTFAPPARAADPSGTPILRVEDVPVAYPHGPTRPKDPATLADAMREWSSVRFQSTDHAALYLRLEEAIHDGEPALVTWFVDFDALEERDNVRFGSFNLSTLAELGPGTQGGHTAVVEDYLARGAGPGLTRADAIDPSGAAVSFRVGNVWGFAKPARAFAPGMPAYHDLQVDYLAGPIARCLDRSGVTDTASCPYQQVPLESVVLPPGY